MRCFYTNIGARSTQSGAYNYFIIKDLYCQFKIVCTMQFYVGVIYSIFG